MNFVWILVFVNRSLRWCVCHRPLSSSFPSTSSVMEWRHEPVSSILSWFVFFVVALRSSYVMNSSDTRLSITVCVCANARVWRMYTHRAFGIVCDMAVCECFVAYSIAMSIAAASAESILEATLCTQHATHNTQQYIFMKCNIVFSAYTTSSCTTYYNAGYSIYCVDWQGRTASGECVKRKSSLLLVQKECLRVTLPSPLLLLLLLTLCFPVVTKNAKSKNIRTINANCYAAIGHP